MFGLGALLLRALLLHELVNVLGVLGRVGGGESHGSGGTRSSLLGSGQREERDDSKGLELHDEVNWITSFRGTDGYYILILA